MMKNKQYVNGQKTYELVGNKLTYFFKDGKVKAEGVAINDLMQGEWKFYRESAQLWQIGHFKDNKKHGRWVRYNKQGKLEYEETFENGKIGQRKA
jgi:antitoxin component YwqK of YwqJK toxin-antitoxin module